jgi:hypothetical protein
MGGGQRVRGASRTAINQCPRPRPPPPALRAGMILWHMLSGAAPFAGLAHGAIIYAVTQGAPLAAPDGTPAAVAPLLSRCLDHDPAARWVRVGGAAPCVSAPCFFLLYSASAGIVAHG